MISANTETKTVEVKTTTYACDVPGCAFVARTEQDVILHFGEMHAVKGVRHLGEDPFYFLDSEESWNAWVQYQSHRHGADVLVTKWHGSGWYLLSTWRQRCSRNCCDDDYLGTSFAPHLIKSRQRDIIEKAKKLRVMRTLLADPPSMGFVPAEDED